MEPSSESNQTNQTKPSQIKIHHTRIPPSIHGLAGGPGFGLRGTRRRCWVRSVFVYDGAYVLVLTAPWPCATC